MAKLVSKTYGDALFELVFESSCGEVRIYKAEAAAE